MKDHPDTARNSFYESKAFYLFLVFSVAFGIRVIHLNSYTSYPAFDLPLGGHSAYVKTALKIIDGDMIGGKEIFYDNSPIYAYILAGIFKIFGIDFYAVRLLQILIGSINCCLITLIAQRYFGILASVVSGMIASFYGPFIFYDAEIIVLPWVVFFSLCSIAVIIRYGLDSGLKMFLAGLLMGAGIMGRPNLILFPAFLILYFLLHPDTLRPLTPPPFCPISASGSDFNPQNTQCIPAVKIFAFLDLEQSWTFFKGLTLKMLHRLRPYAWLCIGVFVMPGLFMARDYSVSGEIVLLNPSGGHNFYFGHHKGASPFFNESLMFTGPILLKYKEKAEADLKKPLSSREVSNYWYKKGLRFIVDNPYEELKLALGKTLFFFNDMEMSTYFNYYFNRDYSVVLRHCVLTFGFVLPLSALGFIVTVRRGRELMVLHLFFLASFSSVVIIFMISRLRIPAIPIFAVFAGVGVVTIVEWCKKKSLKPLALTGLLMVSLYWMTFIPLAQPNYADPHNHLGVVHWYKGKILEAEGSFLKALELKPDFEYPLLNLVKMYSQRGNIKKETQYRKLYEAWKQRYRSKDGETGRAPGEIRP